ncbi:MAG: NUDIX hydrolase [Anaerolineae bacterium]|nr:NUDIX hydrolase [Anaerolineae bacterium]
MQSWKTLSRRTILNHSRYLVVEEHTVELPDGRVITSWPWVILPEYVNVVAVTTEGKFLCFRQGKYGLDEPSLAPVGGYLEAGEEPLTAAQRELLEETGYEAPLWISLGQYQVDGNRGAGTAHFFLALQAQRAAEPVANDLEEQELVYLEQAEVASALAKGEFKLLPWAAITALALLHLNREFASLA